MTENPYKAPLSDSEKTTFENPDPNALGFELSEVSVKAPAICLIVVSVIGILFSLFGLVVSTVVVASEPMLMEEPLVESTGVANFQQFISVVRICCSIVANIVTLIGSINMLQFKNYRFAMVGSIVACIPCCSPLFVLGIPFGIWGLSILNNEAIKSQFAANENGRSVGDNEASHSNADEK